MSIFMSVSYDLDGSTLYQEIISLPTLLFLLFPMLSWPFYMNVPISERKKEKMTTDIFVDIVLNPLGRL